MMKKILGILVLSILFSGNAYSSLSGQGELKLSDYVVAALINYLNTDAVHNKKAGYQQKGNPLFFAVSLSGMAQGYSYCPRGYNCREDPAGVKQNCQKRSGGEKCYIFARGRKIVWNGINYKFKRKASSVEIKDKLEEWGFIGTSTSSSSTSSTSNKAKKSNNSDKDDIVNQIKELKDLLDSGVLTKEEFEKAKKKLLN